MLKLSRKPGESVLVGDEIVVKVLDCRNGVVVLGFDAPHEVHILRDDAFVDRPKLPLGRVRRAGAGFLCRHCGRDAGVPAAGKAVPR
jgi:carbon storage regulator CsrA